MKMKITNQRFNSFMAVMLLSLCFAACQSEFDQDLGPRPTGSFTIEPLEGEPNTYVFTSNVEDAFRHRWNIGEGWYEGGSTDTAYFEMAGEYPINMIAMTRNGHVVEGQTLTVENNAPGVACVGEPEVVIVGCGESQTWVFSPNEPMNFGGPEANPMEWWSQGLDAQNECMVDDEYTFFADNTFVSDHKGSMWGEGDDCVEQPAASTESSWRIFEEDGKTMLDLGDAPLAYDDGDNIYEVVELTADRLHIRKTCCGGGDLNPTRNYVLVPKGTAEEPGDGGEEPEEPEEPSMPYEARDISVDFEGNSTIEEGQWLLDQVTGYEFPVENPAPDDVNASENVFRYDRGTGQYENIQIHLDHKMDLTSRHIFRVKVYFPEDNDYSGTLAQTFSVKLQNREEGGNAWQTQAEIIHTIEDDQLGQWVELTYDFSGFAVNRTDNGEPLWDDVSEATDYDTIVIQPGGEGHTAAGTFYFDDFELLPAE